LIWFLLSESQSTQKNKHQKLIKDSNFSSCFLIFDSIYSIFLSLFRYLQTLFFPKIYSSSCMKKKPISWFSWPLCNLVDVLVIWDFGFFFLVRWVVDEGEDPNFRRFQFRVLNRIMGFASFFFMLLIVLVGKRDFWLLNEAKDACLRCMDVLFFWSLLAWGWNSYWMVKTSYI
jgi:hypothetical protein